MQKLVGNGLYIKKGGCVCEVETDGRGLYLEPTSGKGFSKLGDGLYLKKNGKIYDGKGLLLGPNSPFKKYSYLRYVTAEINDFILTLKNAISSSTDYRNTKAVRIRKTKT